MATDILTFAKRRHAFNDGGRHPLSETFEKLKDAQAAYCVTADEEGHWPWGSPVTSLDQTEAWAAIQTAIWRETYFYGGVGKVGGTVCIPPGRYWIEQPIMVCDPVVAMNPIASSNGICGLTIAGAGRATQIDWHSNDLTASTFQLTDAAYCTIRDLAVLPYLQSFSAIRSMRGNDQGPFNPTSCRFADLWFLNPDGPHWLYGVSIDEDGPGNGGNNEAHVFERVRALSASEACFRLKGQNVHTIRFVDCEMGGAKYGVLAEKGAYFYWERGSGYGTTVADFGILDGAQMVDIHGWDSETSARLLVTGGPTGGSYPVTIRNCRWYGTPPAANALGLGEPAGAVVIYQAQGPLTFRENLLGGSPNPLLWMHVGIPNLLVEFDRNVFDASKYAASALVDSNAWTCIREGRGNYYANPTEGGFELIAP